MEDEKELRWILRLIERKRKKAAEKRGVYEDEVEKLPSKSVIYEMMRGMTKEEKHSFMHFLLGSLNSQPGTQN